MVILAKEVANDWWLSARRNPASFFWEGKWLGD